MEFHVWYRADSGRSSASLAKWIGMQRGDPYQARRRGLGAGILKEYPLVGHYDSRDTGIQRWQLQCMRNAGVTGVFVHLFPDKSGIGFENEDIFGSLLDMAQGVGISVGIHDEAQFVRTERAQCAASFATRATRFLARYGNHPAYLRREGRPLYAFQFWDSWNPTHPSMTAMDSAMSAIRSGSGLDPGWIVFASTANPLIRNEHVWGAVTQSTQLRFNPGRPAPLERDPFRSLFPSRLLHPGTKLGLWVYAGFDDSGLHSRRKLLPRQGGSTLGRDFDFAADKAPDFVMISSWNDWLERSAIEPGSSTPRDPYGSLKAIAARRSKSFTAPVLPSGVSVDPLVRESGNILLGAERSGKALIVHSSRPSGEVQIVGWTSDSHPTPAKQSLPRDSLVLDDPAPSRWLEILVRAKGGGSGLVRRGSTRIPLSCAEGISSVLVPNPWGTPASASPLKIQSLRGSCSFELLRISSLRPTDTLRTAPITPLVHRIATLPPRISHVSSLSSSDQGTWILKPDR